jgi:hypothetical protein
MGNFNDFKSSLTDGLTQLAQKELPGFISELVSSGNQLVTSAEQDMQQWTAQLADGSLSSKDFESLVKGKADLLEMKSLTEKGLALAKADAVKNMVTALILQTALKVFASPA